jgi:hypothetical protein
VQCIHKQYENISFLDSESLNNFAQHLTKIVHELEILSDPKEPCKVASKYLHVVSKRFASVVVSIESLLDISTMLIEEIIGHLEWSRDAVMKKTSRQWEASCCSLKSNGRRATRRCRAARAAPSLSLAKAGRRASLMDRERRRTAGRRRTTLPVTIAARRATRPKISACCIRSRRTSPMRRTRCQRSPLTLLQLLMMTFSCMSLDGPRLPRLGGDDESMEGWYLDTGATSHMTRREEAFSVVDHTVWGTMHFGDGSLIPI